MVRAVVRAMFPGALLMAGMKRKAKIKPMPVMATWSQ